MKEIGVNPNSFTESVLDKSFGDRQLWKQRTDNISDDAIPEGNIYEGSDLLCINDASFVELATNIHLQFQKLTGN